MSTKDKCLMSKHLWILVVASLLGSCAASPIISVSSQHSSEMEKDAVYATLIREMCITDQVEQIVIKDETSLDSFRDDELEEIFRQITLKLPTLQKATFSDFRDRNRQPHRLDETINLSIKYVLISKEEENELLYRAGGGSWLSFYKKYPKSQGITTLSGVGFNPERDQALVYVGNRSGPKTGTGYYVLLARENGNWVIKDRYGAWLS